MTDREFVDREEIFNWAVDIALRNGFNLNKSSNKRVGKNSLLKYQSYRCDRAGTYTPSKEPTIRQNTSTKKNSCLFGVNVVECYPMNWVEGYDNPLVWRVKSCKGYHNHPLRQYKDGQKRCAALNDEQESFVKAQLDAQVPPAQIGFGLFQQSPLQPRVVIRKIYNISAEKREEEKAGRNAAEQTLFLANNSGYTMYVEKNHDEEITHIFMAHPEGVLMFNSWHYVVIIDGTYKTQRYNLPLVEIVGVTPVGKNFLIAYALIESETTESYVWLLGKLKKLLPDGVEPVAIVTDRELGLVAAIPEVFKSTRYILCVWHIKMKVEVFLTNNIKPRNNGAAQINADIFYKSVICAPTEEVYYQKLYHFINKFGESIPLVQSYLMNTWIPHYPKWAKHSTIGIFHLGNSTTGRVESAHAVLKKWLGSSRGAMDTLWKSVDGMLQGQYSEIRAALEHSRSHCLTDTNGRFFSLLGGKIARKAIELMKLELARGEKLGDDVNERCYHAMQTTHGLPCACLLVSLKMARRRVHLNRIHPFWSTLAYDDKQYIIPSDNDLITELFDNLRNCDATTRERVVEAMQTAFNPHEDFIIEPEVNENPKGRPKKSTTRDPSGFEYARGNKSKGKRGATVQSGAISFDAAVGAPSEDKYQASPPTPFRYDSLMPALVDEYLEAWFDPLADGHCGFHVLSHAFTGVQTNHMQMRNLVYKEMSDGRYEPLFNGPIAWMAALNRAGGCTNEEHATQDFWMDVRHCLGFATLFNWAICVISSTLRVAGPVRGRNFAGSATYLPLWATPGRTEPYGVLWILHTGNHFVRLRMSEESPMPPLSYEWNAVRHGCADVYKDPYQARMATWCAFPW